MIAAVAMVLALGLGNPGYAGADIQVHGWNTNPLPPFRLFTLPVGVTSFTFGEGANTTLVATCLLKQQGAAVWRHDGCDADWYDFDNTGRDGCWYDRSQRRWIGYFVTQTVVTTYDEYGLGLTFSLYSEPVALTCFGS